MIGEEQMQELLESEIQIILKMDHPNIVKLYQCCYDNRYINIVMEYIHGEPLSDFLIRKKTIPEDDCKTILRHVMAAIKYFHQLKIVHRDLKLDNIMLTSEDSDEEKDLRVKLIDFGMSKLTQGNKKINLSTYCGTIDFISPEVLEGKTYNEMADTWSCGVIAYFMLSGMPPFPGKTEKEIETNIITCNYHFEAPVWKNISADAKNWIDRMLELDPTTRMSAEESLDHVWLKSHDKRCRDKKIHGHVMLNLHGCNRLCPLLYEMLVLFCQFLNDKDIRAIRETF